MYEIFYVVVMFAILYLQNLVVANGGLSNGVQREQLWSLFAPYGSITDIVMKPHKPYAFVSFSSIDEAVLAVNELNGELLSHGSNHPLSPDPRLYMLYVAECKFSLSNVNIDILM